MNIKRAGIATVLLLIALGAATASAKGKKKSCPPFKIDVEAIYAEIDRAIDEGMRSEFTIAAFVGVALYSKHPTSGASLTWPPSEGASKEQLCLWELLLALVKQYLDENEIPPYPPCPAGTEVNHASGMCEEEEGGTDTDPWESKGFYPRPGSFVQIRTGDRGLGTWSEINEGEDKWGNAKRSLAYTTLLTAGYLAATEAGGLDPDDPAQKAEAVKFAQKVAYSGTNRMNYWKHFISCSPFNDALYMTYGYKKGFAAPNLQGRALRLYPQHYDNRARINAGLPPARNMVLGEKGDAAKGITRLGQNKSEHNFEFLWFPDLNLEALWESDGKILTTEGLEWEDGSSKMNPPSQFMELGFQGVPGGQTWGC